MKTCNNCKNSYPATLEFFYGDSRVASGLRAVCKSCHKSISEATKDKDRAKERLKEWRRENPDKVRAQQARSNKKMSESGYHADHYRKNSRRINDRRNRWLKETGKMDQYNHKRRSLLKEEVTPDEWNLILERYGSHCLVPGCINEDVTVDHVIPLSLGGRNHISNLQPLCKSHNSSKGAKVIDYRLDYGLLW